MLIAGYDIGLSAGRRHGVRGPDVTVLYYNTHRLSAEVEKSGHAAYVTLDEVRARATVLHDPHTVPFGNASYGCAGTGEDETV